MEIRFIASGIGASIPKINFGVNLFSGVYIQLRDTPKSIPYTIGIASTPDIGGSNGTLISSFISTDWSKVDQNKHSWICSKRALVGKTAEIEIKGTLIFNGKVDVAFKVFDEQGESEFSIEKVNIDASGGQVSDTKVRGKVVDMSGKSHSGAICASK